jgi:putative IMPACT (imprinted ancient) family translation regulator
MHAKLEAKKRFLNFIKKEEQLKISHFCVWYKIPFDYELYELRFDEFNDDWTEKPKQMI